MLWPVCAAAQSDAVRQTDGPAELPRVWVHTAIADTPAPGKHLLVKSGEDFQQAIDKAECGDVVSLEAGATFSGEFRLPAKSCDDQHWIVIRTSAKDSDLPAEGTRLTPCYGGVASLPARPALHCSGNQAVTAKLIGSPPLNSRGPVDHYRFIGLELSHREGELRGALLGLGVNSHHVIVDRCWIHGNALDGTQRGIALNGSDLAVVDSTITDIHMVATDTQGIAGWTGSGPLKIANNFIEGGSSSIGFGGSGSRVTPSDIEIRGNHMFKPLSWRLGGQSFIGVRFNTKVLLESKNSSRVLLEGNILENAWGGPQGGDGDAIWFGPKNQSNACPSCEVNDITFRYNIIRHAGGAFYIFDAPSDAGGIAQVASRYSIHDNIFDDIRKSYSGPGTSKGILFRLFGTARFSPPRDISIVHNTGAANGDFLQILTALESPVSGLVIKDNLASTSPTAISGCQNRSGGEVIASCATGSVFENNVLIRAVDLPKSNSRLQKEGAKKINLGPKNWREVGIGDLESDPVDFRLCRGRGEPTQSCKEASAYVDAGSDGRDIGADVTKVLESTRNVERLSIRCGTRRNHERRRTLRCHSHWSWHRRAFHGDGTSPSLS